MWYDNIGAIYLSSNPVLHARTKHIELDYHFVREQVQNGTIRIRFLSSKDQIADIFTKPLSARPFQQIVSKLRLLPTSSFSSSHSPVCGGVSTVNKS